MFGNYKVKVTLQTSGALCMHFNEEKNHTKYFCSSKQFFYSPSHSFLNTVLFRRLELIQEHRSYCHKTALYYLIHITVTDVGSCSAAFSYNIIFIVYSCFFSPHKELGYIFYFNSYWIYFYLQNQPNTNLNLNFYHCF